VSLVDPRTSGLVWLPSCGSTNDEARFRADSPAVTAVATDTQTSGRGRRGRVWFSPPGCGLYLTVIVRDRIAPVHAAVLPLLAGVVTARFARALGADARLKWPNDVLDAGQGLRKLAGVLCESRVDGPRLTAFVGIGLNLRPPPEGYPLDVPAAALGTALDARTVAARLLGEFTAAVEGLPAHDPFGPVVAAWTPLGPAPGTPLRTASFEGAYAGLDRDGALLLDTAAGRRRVEAGEVELVARAP
jgi:BirA family biotin operon repressor/biotin-[acetyl-CoA-carboxylase] ligase